MKTFRCLLLGISSNLWMMPPLKTAQPSFCRPNASSGIRSKMLACKFIIQLFIQRIGPKSSFDAGWQVVTGHTLYIVLVKENSSREATPIWKTQAYIYLYNAHGRSFAALALIISWMPMKTTFPCLNHGLLKIPWLVAPASTLSVKPCRTTGLSFLPKDIH